MPAWDNVQLPPPPSLVPPKADFSTLGEIIPAYRQAQQQARQVAIQDAFKGGLPRTDPNDPNSPVDYKAAAQTYLRLGAPDQAVNMLKLDYYSRPEKKVVDPNSPEGLREFLGGQEGAPQSGAAQPVMPAATPPRQTVSPTGYSGGDNGQNTVASFVTDALGNVPILGRAIVGVARSLGVDPNQPLTAEQQQKIAPVISRLTGAQPQPQGPQQGPMQPQPVEEQTAQGGPGGLLLPQARAPQAQAQQPQQQAPQQQSQQAPMAQLQPWQGATPADAEMPDQLRGRVSPQSYRDYLLRKAGEERDAAKEANKANVGLGMKLDTAPMLAKAAQWEAQAKQITDALAPTDLQKNLVTGAQRTADIQKTDLANAAERWKGIQGASQQYEENNKIYIDRAKSVLNRPETYTGFGGDTMQDFNKFRAIYGDANGALYGDALAKLNSMNVLATIGTMKSEGTEAGQQASRIFSGMVEEARKTGVNINTSIAGNRFLAEMQSRLGEYAVRKRDLAQKYRAEHGGALDDNFNQVLKKDMADHPLFTKAEQQNPSLLGVPTSPYTDPGQTAAWGQQMKLKDGEAIRSPSGKLIHLRLTIRPSDRSR